MTTEPTARTPIPVARRTPEQREEILTERLTELRAKPPIGYPQ